jgi:hypothetical protein
MTLNYFIFGKECNAKATWVPFLQQKTMLVIFVITKSKERLPTHKQHD